MYAFRHRASVVLGACVVFTCAVWVAAAGPGPLAATIPYQGHLELGGAPFNGTADLRFRLYDDPALGGGNLLWQRERSVSVAGGAFALRLGEESPLPDAVFQAAELYLQIDVDGQPLAGVQRIDPVWAAHRSEQAGDFTVTGGLVVEGAGGLVVDEHAEVGPPFTQPTPLGPLAVHRPDNTAQDIATFLPLNETQGVGITYAGVRKVGTNPESHLDLAGKDTGTVRAWSLHTRNGVDQPGYHVSKSRWLLEATFDYSYQGQSVASRAVDIDDARLLSFCGDEDGCTIRLMMEDWISGQVNGRGHAGLGPVHFNIAASLGGQRQWRITDNSYAAAGVTAYSVEPRTGADGNGSTEHVLHSWNCYLTDGVYPPGGTSAGDPGLGFQLMNWNQDTAYKPTCLLIIDD